MKTTITTAYRWARWQENMYLIRDTTWIIEGVTFRRTEYAVREPTGLIRWEIMEEGAIYADIGPFLLKGEL